MRFFKLESGKIYKLTSKKYPQDYIVFVVLADYTNIEKYFVRVTDHGGKTDVKYGTNIKVPYNSIGLRTDEHTLMELEDLELISDKIFKLDGLIQASIIINDRIWFNELIKQKELLISS